MSVEYRGHIRHRESNRTNTDGGPLTDIWPSPSYYIWLVLLLLPSLPQKNKIVCGWGGGKFPREHRHYPVTIRPQSCHLILKAHPVLDRHDHRAQWWDFLSENSQWQHNVSSPGPLEVKMELDDTRNVRYITPKSSRELLVPFGETKSENELQSAHCLETSKKCTKDVGKHTKTLRKQPTITPSPSPSPPPQ